MNFPHSGHFVFLAGFRCNRLLQYGQTDSATPMIGKSQVAGDFLNMSNNPTCDSPGYTTQRPQLLLDRFRDPVERLAAGIDGGCFKHSETISSNLFLVRDSRLFMSNVVA